MNEREAMELCLELALKGWGRVAPNPLVGAVLLRGGQLLSTGFHSEFGQSHAEVDALRSVPDPSGCTCVVNLEPCNHHGKTPPCAEALIEAGVSRVVIGCADPNKKATGGADRLRAAGIEVEFIDVGGRAEVLNRPFFQQHAISGRPFVAVKLAMSADGFIADSAGNSRWISGAKAREYIHWLRAGFAGIAVGRRTAEADDPSLTARGPVPPRIAPERYVFTREGKVNRELRLFTDGQGTTVVTVSGGEEPPVSEGAPPDIADATLEGALAQMRSRGCGSLLVEGGGALVSSLLDAKLVDRLYLITAPILLRGGIAGLPPGDKPTSIGAAQRWRVVERQALGEDNLTVLEQNSCLPE